MMMNCGINYQTRHSEAIESIGKPECTDHNGPNGLTERYRYGSTSKQGYAYLYNDPDMDSYPTCYPSSNVLAASFNKDNKLVKINVDSY